MYYTFTYYLAIISVCPIRDGQYKKMGLEMKKFIEKRRKLIEKFKISRQLRRSFLKFQNLLIRV